MEKKENNSTDDPIILCVTSGKGGVGKTLISTSLAACVIEGEANVLLIDLDFENQGLTSLISAHFEIPASVQKWFPIDETSKPNYKMLKLQKKLFFLPAVATGLNKDVYRSSETGNRLEQILGDLKKKTKNKVDLIILDCHGSSDIFTRIAVRMSNKVLLISEPDPVTFGGTIEWLLEIQEREPSIILSEKLILVLNRLLPKLSVRQLEGILHARLNEFRIWDRPENNRLLCIPTESMISKFFGKVPFIYNIVLGSVFRSKIDLLVFDCLKDTDGKKFIPAKIAKKFNYKWRRELVYRRKDTLEPIVQRHLFNMGIYLSIFTGFLIIISIFWWLFFDQQNFYDPGSLIPEVIETFYNMIPNIPGDEYLAFTGILLFYGYLAFIWDSIFILYFNKTRCAIALVKRVKGSMKVWGTISVIMNAILAFFLLPIAFLLTITVMFLVPASLFSLSL